MHSFYFCSHTSSHPEKTKQNISAISSLRIEEKLAGKMFNSFPCNDALAPEVADCFIA